MLDPNAALIAWLTSSPDLTNLVGGNIFSPYLPEGFSAMEGQKGVVVRTRGGSTHPEITELIEPSFAIEAWAMEAPTAKQIYGLIHDLLHGATSVNLGAKGFVVLAQEEVFGQDILDPETHWAMVVSYYKLMLRGSSPALQPPLLPPALATYNFHRVASAGANATTIKSSPGVIRGYQMFNNSSGPLFVKFHDTASTPTAGSGVVYTVGIQAGEAARDFPTSLWFENGIGMTIVRGIADSDVTPISAFDCVVDVSYE